MSNSETIFPWGHERRYNAYSNYFKKHFGGRVQKLSIDAGFTCPNRDGSKSVGGCTFCNNDAFNPSYCQPSKSITQQLDEGIEFHEWRYKKSCEYLAYFQAYSNTYGPLDKMQRLYSEALSHPKVIGLVIGTRPDCIDPQKLDYLQQLSKDYYITVEYGIESCSDKTLKTINRGHDFQTTVEAIKATAERGLHVGGHLIFGLPGESREEMLAQARILSGLPLHSLKFHQLQIVKGTRMEKEYAQCPEDFVRFSLEEYLDFFVNMLERLRPDLFIERFVGEVPPRFVNETPWGLIRNVELLRLLEQRLATRATWQGRLL